MANNFGRYILEKKLGQGGMGTVYLALDPSLNRKVALKIITTDDAELIERFHREVQSAAKLKHSNIVSVYETGTIGKYHYFTMDYIDGISLEKIVEQNKAGGFEHIARITRQVAEALYYAHNQGVVHRDIKPGNILIDANRQAYLSDFGVAKQMSGFDRSLTMTGITVGTPDFMSPEQAMGEKEQIDHLSDIFSLGVTLYFCLTGGRLPFEGKELYDVFNKIINAEPPSPGTVARGVPRDLETICLKCLLKDRARRYQNARELAEDLDRYLAGEPILARRMTVIGKAWRKVKKNKIATIGTAGALVIAAGVLLGSYFISSAEIARKVAEHRKETYYLFEAGRFDDARVVCEKILELSPLEEDIDSMLERCKKEIREKKARTAKTEQQLQLRQKAKVILDRTFGAINADHKISIAEEALGVDPTFGDAYQTIGYAYKEKNELDKAYVYFSKAIEVAPHLAYSYYERARIMAGRNEKPEEAIADFKKVLEYDPNSHIGYFAKAEIEVVNGDYDAAIADYAKAIEIKPDYVDAYNDRGFTWGKKNEWDRAMEDLDKAIEIDPRRRDAYVNRGYTRIQKGELDLAIADFSKAIEIAPNHPTAYYHRANAYAQKGYYKLVMKDAAVYIQLAPPGHYRVQEMVDLIRRAKTAQEKLSGN